LSCISQDDNDDDRSQEEDEVDQSSSSSSQDNRDKQDEEELKQYSGRRSIEQCTEDKGASGVLKLMLNSNKIKKMSDNHTESG
jgi:hypothetical protein